MCWYTATQPGTALSGAPTMPFFVNIGPIPENLPGVGSRGYHVFRRGRKIITRWGAVHVGSGRRFRWAGKPQEKIYTWRSEERTRGQSKTGPETVPPSPNAFLRGLSYPSGV